MAAPVGCNNPANPPCSHCEACQADGSCAQRAGPCRTGPNDTWAGTCSAGQCVVSGWAQRLPPAPDAQPAAGGAVHVWRPHFQMHCNRNSALARALPACHCLKRSGARLLPAGRRLQQPSQSAVQQPVRSLRPWRRLHPKGRRLPCRPAGAVGGHLRCWPLPAFRLQQSGQPSVRQVRGVPGRRQLRATGGSLPHGSRELVARHMQRWTVRGECCLFSPVWNGTPCPYLASWDWSAALMPGRTCSRHAPRHLHLLPPCLA